MIREASVYQLKKLSREERASYGLRILVMRKWPQGIRKTDIDLWMPSAGPSLALLSQLHLEAIEWDAFVQAYRSEQEQQRFCQVITYEATGRRLQQEIPARSLDHLSFLMQCCGTITLLCWERSERCHRHVLKALLEQNMMKGFAHHG